VSCVDAAQDFIEHVDRRSVVHSCLPANLIRKVLHGATRRHERAVGQWEQAVGSPVVRLMTVSRRVAWREHAGAPRTPRAEQASLSLGLPLRVRRAPHGRRHLGGGSRTGRGRSHTTRLLQQARRVSNVLSSPLVCTPTIAAAPVTGAPTLVAALIVFERGPSVYCPSASCCLADTVCWKAQKRLVREARGHRGFTRRKVHCREGGEGPFRGIAIVRRGGRACVTAAGVALRTLRNVPRVGAKINIRRLPKRAHGTKINLRRIVLRERCVHLFVHNERGSLSLSPVHPSIERTRTHARALHHGSANAHYTLRDA
jgi:hypothetical protein